MKVLSYLNIYRLIRRFRSFIIFINMSRKKTINEFINESINIHGDVYSYDLVNYINNNTKVDIICSKHGVFSVRPNDHLSKKVGCSKCYNAGVSKKNRIKEGIFNRFNLIHNNKYDYSNSEYLGTDIKMDIICPLHGVFKQTPHHHLTGSGCKKCSNVYKPTTDEFIEISKTIHGDLYDYSDVVYINNSTKVRINCKLHGGFLVRPNDHFNKKSGCPICKFSKGELLIKNFLDFYEIEYISQKSFENCYNKQLLKFDFYIPTYNLCIEYDGEQHYKPLKCFGGNKEYLKRVENDKIKTEFCLKNGLGLLRIPYYQYDNIRNMLGEILL